MVSGFVLIGAFVAAIVLMIVAISQWRVHPFLAIMGVALLLAIVVGLPLGTIPQTIGKGFSSIFTSIGIVIILGTLIGLILERSGAAIKLADMIVKGVGPKYPQLAMLLIGWIVSVPVFCDSGFVIVNPIRKWLGKKSNCSSVTLTVALSAGLMVAHVLVPPTPGPIAAAGMVGMDDNLILVIILGIIVSIAPLTAAYFYSTFVGKRVKSLDDFDIQEVSDLYNVGKLPGAVASLMPIVLPIILMGAGSIASMIESQSLFNEILLFAGKPIMALTAGLISALPLLRGDKGAADGMGGTSKNGIDLYDITQDALKVSGPIIFITAAGSVLGQVIVEAGFIEFIKNNAFALESLGLFFPFIIAAILKTAQGSSTVAITTTAGFMGIYTSTESLMYAMNLVTPVDAALVVMAIGAGAMTVSHANDSYFWVVTNFGKLTPQDGYRSQTAVTAIMGVTAMIFIWLLSLFV